VVFLARGRNRFEVFLARRTGAPAGIASYDSWSLATALSWRAQALPFLTRKRLLPGPFGPSRGGCEIVVTTFALELAFSDDPSRLERRPAHRDRLAALRDAGQLLAAGLTPTRAARCCCSAWTPGPRRTRSSPATPYYSGPGVTVVSLKEWNPVTMAAEIG
jgi:hypothetical protein